MIMVMSLQPPDTLLGEDIPPEELKRKKEEFEAFNKLLKKLRKKKPPLSDKTDASDMEQWIAGISAEIDPEKYAKEWSESDLSPLIFTKRIRSMIEEMDDRIPLWLRDFVGGSMGYLSGLFVNVDNLEKLYEVSTDGNMRHEKEKMLAIFLDSAMNDTSNIANATMVLVHTGAIAGKAALVIDPVTAIPVAVLAWAAVGYSTIQLARAMRDYYSPVPGFKDKLIRYKKIKKKIMKINNDIVELETKMANEADEAVQAKLLSDMQTKKRRIMHWITEQEHLKLKAIDIAQVDNLLNDNKKFSDNLRTEFSNLIDKESDESKLINETRQQVRSDLGQTRPFKTAMNDKADEATHKLVTELRKNKRDLIISRTITTLSLCTVATGLSLIAASLFCGQAAPIPFAIGVSLVAIGGGIKLAQVMTMLFVNSVAKHHVYTAEKNKLRKKFKITPDNVDHPLNQPPFDKMSKDTKLNYKLAYENGRERYLQDQRKQYQFKLLGSHLTSYEELPTPLANKTLYFERQGDDALKYTIKSPNGASQSGTITLADLHALAPDKTITRPLNAAKLEELRPLILKITANNGHTPDDTTYEKAWYKSMLSDNVSKKSRKRLLKSASKKAMSDIDDRMFSTAILGEHYTEAESKKILARVSKKDKSKIVKRKFRSSLKTSLVETSGEFFKHQAEKAKDSAANLRDHFSLGKESPPH